MKSNLLARTLVLAAALAVSVPMFAKPVSKSLPVSHNVRFGQVDVKAGDYRVTIDNNHLKLMNGNKTVAETDGRWEEREAKSEYTSILSNAEGRVLELRFEGQKSVFVLAQ